MIYLDNGATTYPKPWQVILSVNNAMKNYGFNSGRGGYRSSVKTAEKIYSSRENIASLFNAQPQNVAFTNNCTTALNLAIKGSVGQGEHIIISSLEHNAVARPVHALARQGAADYDVAIFSYDDEETVENFKSLIKPNTSVIVCMHASNVFGCVFPIREIGALARKHGITFIVDAAQSAGVLDIDMQRDNIDILCAPGHKGLYGPMGTGVIVLNDRVKLATILEGGTGTNSLELEQPDEMPEALESGTLNNSGIIGLSRGVDFVRSKGIENIYKHELALISYCYSQMKRCSDITLYTPKPESGRAAPILSFNYKNYSSEKTAALLASKNIAVRAGYHCSMLAHTSFKTIERGTVRISPSAFTTINECENFLNYLKKLP